MCVNQEPKQSTLSPHLRPKHQNPLQDPTSPTKISPDNLKPNENTLIDKSKPCEPESGGADLESNALIGAAIGEMDVSG